MLALSENKCEIKFYSTSKSYKMSSSSPRRSRRSPRGNQDVARSSSPARSPALYQARSSSPARSPALYQAESSPQLPAPSRLEYFYPSLHSRPSTIPTTLVAHASTPKCTSTFALTMRIEAHAVHSNQSAVAGHTSARP